ncbi:MAG: S1 RNA-binding domain-containing protein [Chloroflexi bacterium]|nr:S1 RNA-binding domain-containing protein [Chloroflexota bacterium]MCC6895648.1 S1 RNA-binding domain-containing protein [Anaerolineae bacterium]
MSSNIQRQDQSPPPMDEGYWSALLQEGEFSASVTEQEVLEEQVSDQAIPNPAIISENRTATTDADWKEIEQIMQYDEVVELHVIGYNRGGLLVEWRSLHGFVPASQLTSFPATANSTLRRNALVDMVGSKLKLRVIELNPEQNRLILSERAAQVEAGERAGILQRLQRGDSVIGTITNLCDFGAFVDLGGLEGLIHISELSWGRVGHPNDILQRGQEVRVHVLEIERDAGRIALSLKRLHPDPWATVNDRYQIGQTVVGTITNVVDFGAFACIEEGLEGLIHVSELAEGHFLHPRNVVSEGQQVNAKVLSIDSRARRLGLSLRLSS